MKACLSAAYVLVASLSGLGCATGAPPQQPTATPSTVDARATQPLGPGASKADRDAYMKKRFCSDGRDKDRITLMAFYDEAGQLGGYSYSGPIMDSPVRYFDAAGADIGSFHIFGDPQTSERVPGSIKQLETRFKKVRRIDC